VSVENSSLRVDLVTLGLTGTVNLNDNASTPRPSRSPGSRR